MTYPIKSPFMGENQGVPGGPDLLEWQPTAGGETVPHLLQVGDLQTDMARAKRLNNVKRSLRSRLAWGATGQGVNRCNAAIGTAEVQNGVWEYGQPCPPVQASASPRAPPLADAAGTGNRQRMTKQAGGGGEDETTSVQVKAIPAHATARQEHGGEGLSTDSGT